MAYYKDKDISCDHYQSISRYQYHHQQRAQSFSMKKTLNKSEGYVSSGTNNVNKRIMLIPHNTRFDQIIKNKILSTSNKRNKRQMFNFNQIKSNQRKVEGLLIEAKQKGINSSTSTSNAIGAMCIKNKSRSVSNTKSIPSRNRTPFGKIVGSSYKSKGNILQHQPKPHIKTPARTMTSLDNSMIQFIQSQTKLRSKSPHHISSSNNIFKKIMNNKPNKNIYSNSRNNSRNESKNPNRATMKKKMSLTQYKSSFTRNEKSQSHNRSATPLFASTLSLKKISNHTIHHEKTITSSLKCSNNTSNGEQLNRSTNKKYINSYVDSLSQSINKKSKQSQKFSKGRMMKYTKNTLNKSNNFFNFKSHHYYNTKQKTTVIDLSMNQDNENFSVEVSTNTTINQNAVNNNNTGNNKLALVNTQQINNCNHNESGSVNPANKLNGIIPIVSNSKIEKTIKRIHEYSRKGYSKYEEKKYNQDAYVVLRNFNNSSKNLFMAICDGHGSVGHDVSKFIKSNLPLDLNKAISQSNRNIQSEPIDDIIKSTFESINHKIRRNQSINSYLSGSTCVSLIYTPTKVITANVGDSRAIIGQWLFDQWTYEDLTRDHKPNIPEEAQRIISHGGRVEQIKDSKGTFIGPFRVWVKDKQFPGLAMSRSFGDEASHSVGVIAEPEIKECNFKTEDKFIILASDGLFEYISNKEIVNIAKEYYLTDNIVGCCEYLYKLSSERWLKKEEVIDDITMIIVFFDD